MQLTGKQIVERGIITNYDAEKAVQQQGVDVRVDEIFLVTSVGYVPVKGKTIPAISIPLKYSDEGTILLSPGYYEVTLLEGCSIPSDAVLNFRTRSSVVRCGGEVRSGQFDAGFHTDKMGCFLKVEIPFTLEKGARIAQAVVTESYPVDDESLYNGQWQGDKQRMK